MSVDLLFAEVDRLIGDKSTNFKNPLAEALASYTEATNSLSQASVDVRARKLFDEADHPQIAKAREDLEVAERMLEEAREQRKAVIESIKAQLPDMLTDEQKTEIRGKRTVARRAIKANIDGLRKLATMLYEDAEFAAAVDAFEAEFDKGKRGSGGGSTSGAPKARVKSVHAVHPNGIDVTGSTFTQAAQRTKLDASLLLNSWLAAAGTQDWKSVKIPVIYTVGEWTVTVTPRDKEESVSEPTPTDIPF